MRERDQPFKQALNDLIRQGAQGTRPQATFQTRTADLGTSTVPLDRALQLAAALEDDELLRRMRTGS